MSPGDDHASRLPAPPAEAPLALIVDDNRLFRWVLAAVLDGGTSPFRCASVATGSEAVAYLRGEAPYADAPRPALVVLDFHLPDMDAPEVLRKVRSSPALRNLPILVLAQAHWAEDEDAALASGATGFRAKPSSIRVLRGVIESFWAQAGESLSEIGAPAHAF